MNELLDNKLAFIGNNYKVIKTIGSGGMGDVYLAEDVKLERLVALKVLKNLSDDSSDNNEYIERFKNEAKSIAKLNHKNIVSIYDIGKSDNIDYIAMEYVEGKNLFEILQNKPLPLKQVLKISKQICEAVSYIHKKEIIHRDIKTSNILVDENSNIKLTDFGIAKKNNNDLMLTQAGTILGSILYSSPEQFINVKSIDERSDIYSLAISIYEMLTGFPPFSDKNSIQQIILSIMSEDIKMPSQYSEKISSCFDNLLKKALNKDPDKRHQSADELLNEINLIEENLLKSNTQINSLNEYISPEIFKNYSTLNVRDTRLMSHLDLSNTTLNVNDFIQNLHLDLSWVNNILSNYESSNQTLFFSDLLSKIREKDMNAKRFSGLISNESYYLFIHQGIIIGAFDIKNKAFGDEVFNSIDTNVSFNKIINTQKDENINLLIYYTLTLSGECLHNNLNSSKVNLFEVIDKLNLQGNKFNGYIVCQKSVDEKSKDKYIFIYNKGEIIIKIKVSEKITIILDDINIEEFFTLGNMNINIYQPKLSILEKEIDNLITKSEFILKYKDRYDGTLAEIVSLGKEEVSHCLSEAVKDNIYFDINLAGNIDKINFFDSEVNITEFVKKSSYYKSCLWIVTEFLFLVNTSGNISYFKDLYKSASEITKFSILDDLKGYYGCNNKYSIIAKDKNDKVIFLARFGNGTKEDVEIFMEETVLVKKNLQKQKQKELFSAFYISNQKIDNFALNHYYKNVKQESGIFNRSKAYLKVGFTDGFNVLLLQNIDKEISLVAPNLFQF